MLALMTPGFLLGLGTQLLWKAMGRTPSIWETALGANVVWGIPFAFLVMLAVWNRYDGTSRRRRATSAPTSATTFREVTLPLVWTGIFGGFLFGFTLTWNDFDRTVLLQNGYDTQTLPLQIGGTDVQRRRSGPTSTPWGGDDRSHVARNRPVAARRLAPSPLPRRAWSMRCSVGVR